MTQFMHINPHFITKREGWNAFYNDLSFDIYTTDRTMDLHENIRRPHYQMQTLDDVTWCLTDAKFFSTLDVTRVLS